ncbi:hypothetical protein JR316_0012045 [Psilocybe cubensis]|uniref:Uncharacterized protein n=2 Tax=Psilocybe cubensis TaxID=181762 RepID=A0ACB8GHF5_PSICU|nr:hypothetical protein JR316_0012045 [Psilocybe cubensis]KAH9474946.1 hypothetical protein JR316_0012045 [Psilocybe cubensis]
MFCISLTAVEMLRHLQKLEIKCMALSIISSLAIRFLLSSRSRIPFFTLMIVTRLVIYHHTIKMLVGSKYASHYTSISSMFIESAAIINILALLTLIGVKLRSPVVSLVLLSYGQIEALASFMIIYRVAKGTAWSSGTAHELISQNVAGNGGFNPSVPDAARLSAMRYRVSPNMTQISTSFNFTHGTGSLNVLSSSVTEPSVGPATFEAPSEREQ